MTPLQMAMVASTVANSGVEMEPQVLNRVVDSGGHTIVRIDPRKLRRVMSRQTASEINSMMVKELPLAYVSPSPPDADRAR